MTLKQQLHLTIQLSTPAILAQLSATIMQYIDASMVGSLGANQSASIGIVETTIWLLGGVCSAAMTGFYVQVAHLIGGDRKEEAKNVLRQGLISALVFGLCISLIGVSISPFLPGWLGANEEIAADASSYFRIFTLCIPFLIFEILGAGMLRSSGNILVPSLLNVLMCTLDVIFNFFLIFPSQTVNILNLNVFMPGAGLSVTGAALGTALAEIVTAVLMLYFLCFRSKDLKIVHEKGHFLPTADTLKKAIRISIPMGIQHIVMCTAYITTTIIVAPLGAVAIAANSFGIVVESLCYMPGYGIADAATTLVGQSAGAGRKDLMKRFAGISIIMGMVVMTFMGFIMYMSAPLMMSIMTPVQEIRDLGVMALRIEAFAEPMFAAAIVSYGVCVGAGDTLIPSGMNFFSMWAVRITLAATLAPSLGLKGVWIAMCTELCFRGAIFLIRMKTGKWMNKVGKL
ncbi:MAG: MATE family efflux transporter [Phocaeicola sp.]|uniref:MATE family efflux transporter n=1 Tax=Phocaeicola TaxID=909656 RepID=UPI00234E9B0F|nr:MATE family efflux transporter [Phocaeicola oris]MCE2616144.1 MATE family efflux transporter [Phocaeicola oris]